MTQETHLEVETPSSPPPKVGKGKKGKGKGKKLLKANSNSSGTPPKEKARAKKAKSEKTKPKKAKTREARKPKLVNFEATMPRKALPSEGKKAHRVVQVMRKLTKEKGHFTIRDIQKELKSCNSESVNAGKNPGPDNISYCRTWCTEGWLGKFGYGMKSKLIDGVLKLTILAPKKKKK